MRIETSTIPKPERKFGVCWLSANGGIEQRKPPQVWEGKAGKFLS